MQEKFLKHNSARLPQRKVLLFMKEACSEFSWQSLRVRATGKSAIFTKRDWSLTRNGGNNFSNL